jgi:hypothetical protein
VSIASQTAFSEQQRIHQVRVLKLVVPIIMLTGMVMFVMARLHSAPPVRDKVLDEVEIVDTDGEVSVEVRFSFPLRYRSHFPPDDGEELRVRLRPVRVPVSDVNAVPRRESVIPPYGDAAAVDEVIYEGDIEGGPYLTIRFTRSVHYRVIPGSDYRSIRVIVGSIE